MARETSIIAYNAIKDSGLLSKLKWRVYDYLYKFGPLTAKQINIRLGCATTNSGVYTTRLSELRRIGVVEEVGRIECEYSGQKVILWDVNKNLPIKHNKKTKTKTKDKIIKELEKENKALKKTIKYYETFYLQG